MKKTLPAIILAFCICFAYGQSQTLKGNGFIAASTTFGVFGSVGGGSSGQLASIGFSSIKLKSDAQGFSEPEPDKFSSFNIQPRAGFFVSDNFAIGADLTLGFSSSKAGDSESQSNQTTLAVGPFIRNYFPVENVLPYFEVGAAFGSVKSKFEDPEFDFDEEDKSKLLAWDIGIGVGIPVGQKATFDVAATYNSLSVKADEDNPDNVRTVIGTVGIKLSVLVFLGSNEG